MRVRAKDLARVLLDLRDARTAADDWQAAANDQADTITQQAAMIEAKQARILFLQEQLEETMTVSARRATALQWIGTECATDTKGRCWHNTGRTPTAEYLADRWCHGCMAAWGLGVDNPPELLTT